MKGGRKLQKSIQKKTTVSAKRKHLKKEKNKSAKKRGTHLFGAPPSPEHRFLRPMLGIRLFLSLTCQCGKRALCISTSKQYPKPNGWSLVVQKMEKNSSFPNLISSTTHTPRITQEAGTLGRLGNIRERKKHEIARRFRTTCQKTHCQEKAWKN